MKPKPLMTQEYAQALVSKLGQQYGRFFRPGESFEIGPHEAASDAWTLKITFQNADRSLHLPVELAVVASENPRLTNDEARDVLVDFVGYFFERYFRASRQVTLPLDWTAFPFGDYSIRARGWERNMKLESAADRILRGESVEDVL